MESERVQIAIVLSLAVAGTVVFVLSMYRII